MRMLADMSMGQWFLALLMIVVCCLLMLVILLQKGGGGGLAGAFGGGGGDGGSAFGAKTGDVFTWITVVVATLFIVLNVVSNFAFDQSPVAVAAPSIAGALPEEGLPEATPDSPSVPIEVDGTTLTPEGSKDAGEPSNSPGGGLPSP